MIDPSSGEAVVGRGVLGRYEGTRARAASSSSGAGAGRWSASSEPGGSSFESEVWVDVRELANDAKRPLPFSGIRGCAPPPRPRWRRSSGASTTIRATPSRRERETDYYAKQSESANARSTSLVIGIAVLAGIGAGFGAANTMYAARAGADRRDRDAARARASRAARSLVPFQIEAAIARAARLSARGRFSPCAARLVLRWVLGGVAFGAATFTTNVITLRVTAGGSAIALGLALRGRDRRRSRTGVARGSAAADRRADGRLDERRARRPAGAHPVRPATTAQGRIRSDLASLKHRAGDERAAAASEPTQMDLGRALALLVARRRDRPALPRAR